MRMESGVWVRSMALGFAVLMLGGCAMMRQGSHGSPIAQRAKVQATLEQWRDSLLARDQAAVMATISDEFVSNRFGNKTDYGQMLARYAQDGTLDGAEIDFESAQITVENNVASAYPIHVKLPSGGYNLAFHLRREEEGAWRIIGMDADRG